jgi:hypothetical protein
MMQSSMVHIRALRAMPLVLACALAASCAGNAMRSTDPGRYGFLVLGPTAADRFDLTAGDTLPEFRRSELGGSVLDSASQRVVQLGLEARCSRYFGKADHVLVLLQPACDRREETADGGGLLVLTSQGHFIGQAVGPLWGYYSSVTPPKRPPW